MSATNWAEIIRAWHPRPEAACWECESFLYEKQFQERIDGRIEKLAQDPYDLRTKAASRCPDTGTVVRTYSLNGDMLASPYTGRRFTQGNTGYFGPKARDNDGRISHFGGDALKKDLGPATASLLIDATDITARAFVSIPGILRQQYHFACKNWARLYPLLGEKMGEEWRKAFQDAVGRYEAFNKPSDGERDHGFVGPPHDLVGQPGHLLGGDMVNGGTENHKMMWRTSALVYAQQFPEGARISHHERDRAAELVSTMIFEFAAQLGKTGNGEYDSSIYYPHSIEGLLNLYDFSVDPAVKSTAKIILDYLVGTAALKIFDGVIAGGQKRGHAVRNPNSEFASMIWAWGADTSWEPDNPQIPIHQVLSTYRPNKVLCNILNKNIPLPFESRMSRPTYHCNIPNVFQEYFYCDRSFAMGNVALAMVDNPDQQVVWSLVAKGKSQPLIMTGGHVRHCTDSAGHSPYTQTFQHENVLIALTAQFGSESPGHGGLEEKQRSEKGSSPLVPIEGELLSDTSSSERVKEFLSRRSDAACSHLWIPKEATVERIEDTLFVTLNKVVVAVRIIGDGRVSWVTKPPHPGSGEKQVSSLAAHIETHDLLLFTGEPSGFVLEVLDAEEYGSSKDPVKKYLSKSRFSIENKTEIRYNSTRGKKLEFKYYPRGLRARGSINDTPIDYENWVSEGPYENPYVSVDEKRMVFSDGTDSYTVDLTKTPPEFC